MDINETSMGKYQFIWGVKSPSDKSKGDASFLTLNKISIIYDTERKIYMLNLAEWKDLNYSETELFLKDVLNLFYNYIYPSYNMQEYILPSIDSYVATYGTLFEATTMIELFLNFCIFVKGYNSLLTIFKE